MQSIDNKKTLMQKLAQGAVIITPNNRLSASLLENYIQYTNRELVDKPQCLPYQTFIHHLYQDHISHEMSLQLLNEHQTRYLWTMVLQSHHNITYSEGLLNAVIDAWNRCTQWQISPDHEIFNFSPQCRLFQKWWTAFNQRLTELKALSASTVVDYLMTVPQQNLKQEIIWVCFDEFTPQQQAFQQHLTQQNKVQYYYDLPSRHTISKQYAAKDNEDEIQQLLSWVRMRLEAGDQKIAVVVPDLQQRSHPLQRQLKRHLDPALFNLSLGQSLKAYPLIIHGLALLTLSQQLSRPQAQLLLSSPYIQGSQDEFHARTQIMQDSQLLHEKTISLTRWVKALEKKAPILGQSLKSLNPYPQQATPQQWIELFYQRLTLFGFPGDYLLNSENYQCFQRLEELFNTFRQLSAISQTLEMEEAIQILNHLAEHTVFQAKTTPKPIQILGVLEASGCEFDSIWIMGLTDQCLPQKARLSPFIPHTLQKERHMPRSSPERELAFAQKLIQRFQHASPHNVFSYPMMSADSPNLPSPMLSAIPSMESVSQSLAPHNKPDLIRNDDDYLIPLRTAESVSGGTTLLANQAKCPFRAFAAHRLKAKAPHKLSEGLDPMERGQIIHKVMEVLWRSLGSQKKLLSLTQTELDDCIQSSILTALTPFLSKKEASFPSLVQEIEMTRLKRIVHDCLEWEKQRPAFKVDCLEKEFIHHIHNLELTVRVDRIDSVGEKNKWVIDYKNTIPPTKPWTEDRPREPQLLLYALLDDTINTLMFLQLKTGHLNSQSLSEDPLDLAGNRALKKEESWSAYKAVWQEQLTNLAEEFSQGHCPPEPLNASICQFCEFQSLCRFKFKTLEN